MPLAAILLLVTMKSIPEDLYRAAKRRRRQSCPALPAHDVAVAAARLHAGAGLRDDDRDPPLRPVHDPDPGRARQRVLDAVMADLCRDLPQPALRLGLRARLYPRRSPRSSLGYLADPAAAPRRDAVDEPRARPSACCRLSARSALLLFIESSYSSSMSAARCAGWSRPRSSPRRDRGRAAELDPAGPDAVQLPGHHLRRQARSPTRTAGRAIPRPGASSPTGAKYLLPALWNSLIVGGRGRGPQSAASARPPPTRSR